MCTFFPVLLVGGTSNSKVGDSGRETQIRDIQVYSRFLSFLTHRLATIEREREREQPLFLKPRYPSNNLNFRQIAAAIRARRQ